MENINFCPSCGHKIEGSPKFCVNCGKQLAEESKSGFSFSKVGKSISGFFGKVKESDIYGKAVDSLGDVTNKVKDAVKEKTESTRVIAKVVGKVYNEKEERVISKMYADYSDSILGKSAMIEFTNQTIKIYETANMIEKKLDMAHGNKLMYNIPLTEITEVYKQKNLVGNTIYYIVTPEKSHPIYMPAEQYKFFFNLLSVLKFDGCLFNVDISPEETVLCVTNGKLDGSSCTIYLTDKRVLAATVGNLEKLTGGKVAAKAEGVNLALDVELSKADIKEEPGKLNVDYVITTQAGCHRITFSKLVPEKFLAIVPGAVGNKEQLERKKKLKKGLKVVTIAASVLGASAFDADASDNDVDDDDIDVEGDVDAFALDTDGDGQFDTLVVDSDGDGAMDSLAVDSDGDGAVDKAAYDTDGDGKFDEIEMDTDGDGVMDTAGVDSDGDGNIDTITEGEVTGAESGNGVAMEEESESPQIQVMRLDRQIMNTADPLQREALIRERDFILSQHS